MVQVTGGTVIESRVNIKRGVRFGCSTTYREPAWGRDKWRLKRIRALNLPPLSQEMVFWRLSVVPAPLNAYAGSMYWPCEARLASGEWIDRVCLVRARDWLGPWPHEMDGPYLDISDIVEVRESPSRLPAPFIYETQRKALGLGFNGGMVEIVLADGRSVIMGGEFFDFPPYPKDAGPIDVVEVRTPTRDRMAEALFPARPIWCLVD